LGWLRKYSFWKSTQRIEKREFNFSLLREKRENKIGEKRIGRVLTGLGSRKGQRFLFAQRTRRPRRRARGEEASLAANMKDSTRKIVLMSSQKIVTIRIGAELVEKTGA
jgi:hypothetical protein